MTEIPEHLLRRSRERREALGLSEPGAAPPTPEVTETTAVEATAAPAAAAVTPATRAAVPAPVEVPPPPAPPDPPYIDAAKRRKRIPIWAMPVLAFLPLWAAIFAFTLEPPSAGANDPLTLGDELYQGKCASCHGAQGQGGVGPSFQNGGVVETWPNWRNHFTWVKTGSAQWPGDTYGATEKDKNAGIMPGFGGELTDDQILLIVRYEREVLAGAEPEQDLVDLTVIAAEGGDLTEQLSDAQAPGDGPGGTSEPPPAGG
jgi:mono/diheme cytochrome c family protein